MDSQANGSQFSDVPPSSERDAEQLIEEIRGYREDQRTATPDEEVAKFQRMQERILESLDDSSQVIPELLQNADDVGGDCTEVTLQLTDDALVVTNHGEQMTEAEIAALGEFTRSTKHDLSYIGHFGIGFKTVFSVTDSPHIETGYTSFKYDKSDSELPVLDSGEYVDGTRIRLPFADDLSETRLETLKNKLESIDRLLPFLNNLESIRVEVDGEARVYERIETGGDTRTIRERFPEDDSVPTVARYRLFSESLTTDSGVFEMLADEREFNAADLEERNVELEVTVAIPVSDEGTPVSSQDSRLFCYFPASNDTLLPFDVQADFLLKSNREEIRPGHPLNERFLSVAGGLVETAIPEFKTDDIAPEALLELVPDLAEDRPSYLDPLLKRTRESVSRQEIVPVASGGVYRPEEIIILPEELRSLLPLDKFAQAYSDAEAHPEEELEDRYYERLEVLDRTQSLSMAETLEQLSDMDLLQSLEVSDIVELLAAVERYLDGLSSYREKEKAEIERTIAALESLPVFSFQGRSELEGRHTLTEAGENIYRPARQDESVYEAFYDELDLLSGDLVAELRSSQTISGTTTGRVQDLLADRLGIEELTHRDIVRDVINEAFSSPGELPDETLDDYLEYVRDHARGHLDVCEIRLRAGDGTYVEPESLYLPTAYNEGRYRSTLLFSTLSDKRAVSESYLERVSEEAETDTESWRTFFVDLGVQSYIPVSKDADQCTKETFQSVAEIREFLTEHDDEGTDVRKDKDTEPYGGRDCSWMRSADARHGLIDWAFSSSFEKRFQEVVKENPELGGEFVKMLDANWEGVYQDAAYREYYFSVRNNGYETRTESSRCPTTFTHFLRTTELLPGEDKELYQPSHLFERNSITKRADVTLLAESIADISPELHDLLKIRDDVGITEHRIGIEQAIAERTERDADAVDSEIRSHLQSLADQIETASEEEKSQLTDELQDCPFIYIPEATSEFRTPERVAWSEGIGEYIVPINTYYRGLHELLVEVLDIPPEPTLDTYIEFFQYADEERWSAIEEAWREIVRRVVRDDSLEQDATDIATKLGETGSIPNANESLVSSDEIEYVARREGATERLPDSIANTVAFPSYDQRFDRDEIIDSLATILNADALEEEMEQTVTNPAYEERDWTLYDGFTQGLEVGNSVLRNREAVQAAEHLISVADYTLQQTDRITCEYHLKDEQRVKGHEEAVYIDEEQGHILIKEPDAAWLDLVDALAATLDLTGADKNAFVDFLKGAVGKPPELVDAYLDGEDISRIPIDAGSSESAEPRRSGRVTERSEEEEEEEREPVSATQRDDDSTLSADIEESSTQGTNSTISKSSQNSAEKGGEAVEVEGSYRERESWASSNESTGTAPDKDDISPTPPTNEMASGGGGARAPEVGRQGEEFVMDYLEELLQEAFDTTPTSENTQTGLCLTGHYNSETREIHLDFVPDKSDPHCDILVTGATLRRDEDGLLVESIADSAEALVEVKSAETKGRRFELSGPEHSDAQDHPENYFIIRVVDIESGSPRVEAVFDSVPELEADITPNSRLRVERYDYTLELSY